MAKNKSVGYDYAQNAVKTLAANIRFASLDNPIKTLVITSSVPNEGKSSISISLAEAMAGGGRRVLLVECDMRRRSLANMLGVHARNGLYDVLSSQVSLEDAVVDSGSPDLDFLDCEPHIPNPVDVLQSKRFQRFIKEASEKYSFVLFDTPPLSAFVDAAVIGGAVDGCILVVRRDFTKREEILGSFNQLKKGGADVIGTVLNFCESGKSEYYHEYYSHDAAHDNDGPRLHRSHHTHEPVEEQEPVMPEEGASQMPRRRSATATSPAVSPMSTEEFIMPDLASARKDEPASQTSPEPKPAPKIRTEAAPAPKKTPSPQSVPTPAASSPAPKPAPKAAPKAAPKQAPRTSNPKPKARRQQPIPEIDVLQGSNIKPIPTNSVPPGGYYYPSGYDD